MPTRPHPSIEHVRELTRSALTATVELATQIAIVPAPTGDESRRAARVVQLLSDRGLPAWQDDIGNVYATPRGPRVDAGAPIVMIAAHLDTVFPADMPIAVAHAAGIVRGPGIGDNSLGVAASIVGLDMLQRLNLDVDVVLALTVGEEGLGNLRGITAAMDQFGTRVKAVIAVEGHNLGRVTHMAVGSKRWRIRVSGPGGHSWGAFGQPNAIHGLARVIAAIDDLAVSDEPKTSYNVGIIEGGVSVNTIAPSASALVDLRSVDAALLDDLARRVRTVIRRELPAGLHAEVDILGERPAGRIDRGHPLVARAGQTLRALGIEPIFDASSTDANIPISRGVPAVCIGITRGGNGHTIDEYIEIGPIELGIAQLVVLCVDVADMLETGLL